MPAGMQIINTHGSVLIDSENPCLVHVGTYTKSDLISSLPFGSILRLTDATDHTVLAYAGGESVTLSHVERPTSSRRDYWFAGMGITADKKIYRFERVRNSTSNFGLVLRDSSGQVTFDAAQKPGRVIGTVSNSNVSIPAGREYAIVFAQSHWSSTFVDFELDGPTVRRTTNYYQTRGRISGNVIYFEGAANIFNQSEIVPSTLPRPPNVTKGFSLGVILDVTGY